MIKLDSYCFSTRFFRKPFLFKMHSTINWNCAKCTFCNNTKNIQCEMCQNPRAMNNGWQCSHCTFLNDINCGMCRLSRNAEQKPDEIADLATQQLHTFGHESFRQYQMDIIRSVMTGDNVMLILSTGGGKSLSYQIPILIANKICNEQQINEPIQHGIGIIVSPLISLIKDQISSLKRVGVDADGIHSSIKFSV